MTSAVQADGLIKSYGEVRALDGLAFSVEEGTVFGLLGPNGAGKSTTVKVLTTLARPDGVGRAWRATTCLASRAGYAVRSASWRSAPAWTAI